MCKSPNFEAAKQESHDNSISVAVIVVIAKLDLHQFFHQPCPSAVEAVGPVHSAATTGMCRRCFHSLFAPSSDIVRTIEAHGGETHEIGSAEACTGYHRVIILSSHPA